MTQNKMNTAPQREADTHACSPQWEEALTNTQPRNPPVGGRGRAYTHATPQSRRGPHTPCLSARPSARLTHRHTARETHKARKKNTQPERRPETADKRGGREEQRAKRKGGDEDEDHGKRDTQHKQGRTTRKQARHTHSLRRSHEGERETAGGGGQPRKALRKELYRYCYENPLSVFGSLILFPLII